MELPLVRLGRILQASGYHFVTPTPATHARVNARPENGWARDLRGVFGWSRRFWPDLLPGDLLETMRAGDMLADAGEGLRSRVRFSTLDGMLFAHSAFPTEAADAVFFGPDTYRFAAAIASFLGRSGRAVRRAVDIGCGAGPGAILIARERPGAEVAGVDINPAALRMTEANAALAGVAVAALPSDLLSGIEGRFDLIVANPPYLADPAERTYRHGGGPLGAGLSLSILREAPGRLAPGGTLLLYTGVAIVDGEDPLQAAAAAALGGGGLRWTYHEVDPDVFGEELASGPYVGSDRIAAVVLAVTKDE